MLSRISRAPPWSSYDFHQPLFTTSCNTISSAWAKKRSAKSTIFFINTTSSRFLSSFSLLLYIVEVLLNFTTAKHNIKHISLLSALLHHLRYLLMKFISFIELIFTGYTFNACSYAALLPHVWHVRYPQCLERFLLFDLYCALRFTYWCSSTLNAWLPSKHTSAYRRCFDLLFNIAREIPAAARRRLMTKQHHNYHFYYNNTLRQLILIYSVFWLRIFHAKHLLQHEITTSFSELHLRHAWCLSFDIDLIGYEIEQNSGTATIYFALFRSNIFPVFGFQLKIRESDYFCFDTRRLLNYYIRQKWHRWFF